MSIPASADTTTDTGKKADALFVAGREAASKNDFVGACAKFEEAQTLQSENVAILLNLGQCNEKQGKFGSALKWYRKTVNSASENTKNDPALQEYVSTAAERAGALANTVAKVTFDLSKLQPGALATIDGETIRPTELTVYVDKGTRKLAARLAGKKTSEQDLVVVDGQSLTHAFEPLEDAPLVGNRRRRRLKGALIGGAIILAASAGAGAWAYSIQSDFDDKVKAGANPDKQKFQDKMLPPTLIWAGGMAAGIGIAAYFFFTAPPGERLEEVGKTAFAPTVTNSSVGFAMFRRF